MSCKHRPQVPQRPTSDRPASCPRRGAALIVVMIVLLLCVALGTRLAVNVSQGRKVARAQQRALQADWLAESGVRRAAARLALDPGYTGETWNVTAAELGGASAAAVTIRVEAAAENELLRRVRVEAVYPVGEAHRAGRTREINLQLIEQGEET